MDDRLPSFFRDSGVAWRGLPPPDSKAFHPLQQRSRLLDGLAVEISVLRTEDPASDFEHWAILLKPTDSNRSGVLLIGGSVSNPEAERIALAVFHRLLRNPDDEFGWILDLHEAGVTP